jgi:hypothetical protein
MSSAVQCLSWLEILCPIFDHPQEDRITLYSALFVNSTWSIYSVEVLWKGDYLLSAPGCEREEIDPCESWKRQCSFSRLLEIRLALRGDPANNVAPKPDPRPQQTPGGHAQFLERSPKLRSVLAASSTRSHSGIAAFFGRLTSLKNLEELSLPLLSFDHVSLTRWIHQREGKRVAPKLTHLAIQISSQGAQIPIEPILSRLTSLTIGLLNSRDV